MHGRLLCFFILLYVFVVASSTTRHNIRWDRQQNIGYDPYFPHLKGQKIMEFTCWQYLGLHTVDIVAECSGSSCCCQFSFAAGPR